MAEGRNIYGASRFLQLSSVAFLCAVSFHGYVVAYSRASSHFIPVGAVENHSGSLGGDIAAEALQDQATPQPLGTETSFDDSGTESQNLVKSSPKSTKTTPKDDANGSSSDGKVRSEGSDKPIAICIVGQMRNKGEYLWRNMYERLVKPIAAQADVFIVISDGKNDYTHAPKGMGEGHRISDEEKRLFTPFKPKETVTFTAAKEGLLIHPEEDNKVVWLEDGGKKNRTIANCYWGIWQAFGLEMCWRTMNRHAKARGRPYDWAVRVRNDLLPYAQLPPYEKWPTISSSDPPIQYTPYIGIGGACGPGSETTDGLPSARACQSDHFAVMTWRAARAYFHEWWEAFRDCEPDPLETFGDVIGDREHLCPECTLGSILSKANVHKKQIGSVFLGGATPWSRKCSSEPENEWVAKPLESLGPWETWYSQFKTAASAEAKCEKVEMPNFPEQWKEGRSRAVYDICKILLRTPPEINLTIPTTYWQAAT